MIGKILIEINRLKNELDGYSAKEGLDYIKSYINTLSKQQVKEPDKSLEEAARLYADNQIPTDYPNYFCRQDITDAFIAGAEWQAEKCDEETSKLLYAERQTAYINGWDDHKQQMLKEAEECELVCIKDCLAAILPMKEFQWTVGDKVRIIVIKDESK